MAAVAAIASAPRAELLGDAHRELPVEAPLRRHRSGDQACDLGHQDGLLRGRGCRCRAAAQGLRFDPAGTGSG